MKPTATQTSLWRPPTKELVYISMSLTEEELDRFVDLCCHHVNALIVSKWAAFSPEDHGLAALGLIDIVKYDSPVTLRLTTHGVEIFEDLKRHDPVSLINACIRLEAWYTASYFVWALLSASQLPEFLSHDNKEIRGAAGRRIGILI